MFDQIRVCRWRISDTVDSSASIPEHSIFAAFAFHSKVLSKERDFVIESMLGQFQHIVCWRTTSFIRIKIVDD